MVEFKNLGSFDTFEYQGDSYIKFPVKNSAYNIKLDEYRTMDDDILVTRIKITTE